jgi:hypothetical protein
VLCLQGGTTLQSGGSLVGVGRGSLVRVPGHYSGSEDTQCVGHVWLVDNTDGTVRVQLYDPNTGGR